MMKQKLMTGLMAIGAMSLVACASGVKKAEIASDANPTDEIAKLDKDIQAGYSNHYDLLAQDDFTKAQEYLKEAKEELADGEEQDEVLEELAYGRAHLERARETSESRRGQVSGILTARDQALEANVRAYPPARQGLKELDDEVRSEADDLRDLSAEEIATLQSNYLQLQLDAVKNNELGKARAQIKDAKENDADDYAPKALRQAELDYANAENVINVNRNNPEGYEEAVAKSVASADMLAAVLRATDSGRVNEDTATRVVMQDRQIDTLQGQVGTLSGELGATTEALESQSQAMRGELESQEQAMRGELEARDRQLASAAAMTKFRESLEEARSMFGPDEAEVYQQGDKLVIRLKSMNFQSGSANLPSESMEVLSKIRSIAEDLSAQQVAIEGHTDSTGSPQINAQLSQERAQAVANYLTANGIEDGKVMAAGYGFERPIASNRSAEGRAQNRRVDILITPEGPGMDADRATSSVPEGKKQMKGHKHQEKDQE